MRPQKLYSQRAGSGSFPEASEAWRQHDYQGTIDILRHACETQPANSKLLLNLGEAYGRRYEYEQAGHFLERAIKVAPSSLQALTEAARRCQRFGQPSMAKRFFTRAAEHPDAGPEILLALAEFAESHSRTGEACEDQAIALCR